MSSVMGNPPAAVEEQPEPGAPATTPEPPEQPAQGATPPPPPAAGRSCSHCAGPLAPGQEWCLNCGAATRGSLENQRWRSTTAIAVGVAALALGAAAAAYAALDQHSPKQPQVVQTVAQTLTPTTTPPAATPPVKTPVPATPAHAKLPIPLQKTKLPKIPLTAITPTKATDGTGTSSSGTSEGAGSGTSGTAAEGKEGAGTGEASEPTAIVLDTDAASTYNPYALPVSYFGDPSLVIDGDPTTAWTAEVNPASAPAMAEGVLLDVKSPHKLSALKLDTQTTGMTVQIYGTTLAVPPETIVNSAWTALSAPRVLKKHVARFKLRHQKKGFRNVLVWISKAPASQAGSAQAPGHVTIGEVELFPAS